MPNQEMPQPRYALNAIVVALDCGHTVTWTAETPAIGQSVYCGECQSWTHVYDNDALAGLDI